MSWCMSTVKAKQGVGEEESLDGDGDGDVADDSSLCQAWKDS